MEQTPAVQPITEDDIAQFLLNTPEFFERHADVLAGVQLTSPHGKRAVSLQERQAEMLRDKIKHLELRNAQMIRFGHENVHIAHAMHDWTCALLPLQEANQLPAVMMERMQTLFDVPQTALRVWNVNPQWAGEPFAQSVSDDAKTFAESLTKPYCGPNRQLEVAGWLPQPDAAASLALLPLRLQSLGAEGEATTFGLFVLASDQADRFTPDMGTDFLERMAELAAAGLERLRA
jgi:uncharacterized protein YigA (DUF484 family)